MPHPNANDPGNVPLYRCDKGGHPACDASGRPGDCWNSTHHPMKNMCRCCTGARCTLVGFRTPEPTAEDDLIRLAVEDRYRNMPRCEDCEHYDNHGFSETACKLGTRCRGKDHFTPRQRKGQAK